LESRKVFHLFLVLIIGSSCNHPSGLSNDNGDTLMMGNTCKVKFDEDIHQLKKGKRHYFTFYYDHKKFKSKKVFLSGGFEYGLKSVLMFEKGEGRYSIFSTQDTATINVVVRDTFLVNGIYPSVISPFREIYFK